MLTVLSVFSQCHQEITSRHLFAYCMMDFPSRPRLTEDSGHDTGEGNRRAESRGAEAEGAGWRHAQAHSWANAYRALLCTGLIAAPSRGVASSAAAGGQPATASPGRPAATATGFHLCSIASFSLWLCPDLHNMPGLAGSCKLSLVYPASFFLTCSCCLLMYLT